MWTASVLLALALAAAAPPVEQLRAEAALLHHVPALATLKRQAGDGFRLAEPPAAPVLCLHLWATYCAPCLEEMAALRDLLEGTRRRAPTLATLPVAEIGEDGRDRFEADLLRFARARGAELPRSDGLYLISERMRRGLGAEQLPLTLLLDRGGVVRQALLGSVLARADLLRGALLRLAAPPLVSFPLPAPALGSEAPRRLAETALLHRRVNLFSLQQWSGTRLRPAAVVAAAVTVLLQIPAGCTSCVAELPLWRRMLAALAHGEQDLTVTVLVVARSEGEFHDFLRRQRGALPSGSLNLLVRPAGGPEESAAVLLDRERVVRQVLIGPVDQRRREWVDGVERLLTRVRGARGP